LPDEVLAGAAVLLLELEDVELALADALAGAVDTAALDDAPDAGLEAATGFNTVMAGAADETLLMIMSLHSRSNLILLVSLIGKIGNLITEIARVGTLFDPTFRVVSTFSTQLPEERRQDGARSSVTHPAWGLCGLIH
jgi:hypothetical protein